MTEEVKQGVVRFLEEDIIHRKYAVITDLGNESEYDEVQKNWKLKRPNLILILQDTTAFELAEESKSRLLQSLKEMLKKNSGVWIISDGVKFEMSELVGMAIKDTGNPNTDTISCTKFIGITTLPAKPEVMDEVVGKSISENVILDSTFSHFLFTRESKEDRSPKNDMTASLLKAVSKPKEPDVPVAWITLSGDQVHVSKDVDNVTDVYGYPADSIDLDKSILDAVFQGTTENVAKIKLAIKLNRVDKGKEFLEEWKNPTVQDLHELAIIAVLENNTDFVSLLLILNKGNIQKEELVKAYEKAKGELNRYFPKEFNNDNVVTMDVVGDVTKKLIRGFYLDEKEKDKGYDCCSELQGTILGLFLRSLLMNEQEMSKCLWKHGEDKLAAALAACGILNAMAKREEDPSTADKMKENAEEFNALAIAILDECFKNDQKYTHVLLETKMAPWSKMNYHVFAAWTENKDFIARPACQTLLEKKWTSGLDIKKNFQKKESKKEDLFEEKLPKVWNIVQSCFMAPILVCVVHTIFYILFLLLYSYNLLSLYDDTLSDMDIVLSIWVFAIYVEEARKVILSVEFLLMRIKTSLTIIWVILEVSTILLYVGGMIIKFIPLPGTMDVSRLLHGICLIAVYCRLLQNLSIYKQLGPKLVMVGKMFIDLMWFMVILFIIVVAYAIALNSIRFPNSTPSQSLFAQMFKSAYWNMYGELFLEEMHMKEPDCTFNPALYNNGTLPRCPEGEDAGVILLGSYVLVCNVLMLNLLIAMFSYSIQSIQNNPDIYWSYQRYFLIIGYTQNSILPPPLNLVYILVCFLRDRITEFIKKRNPHADHVCCGPLEEDKKAEEEHSKELQRWKKETEEIFLLQHQMEKESFANNMNTLMNLLKENRSICQCVNRLTSTYTTDDKTF